MGQPDCLTQRRLAIRIRTHDEARPGFDGDAGSLGVYSAPLRDLKSHGFRPNPAFVDQAPPAGRGKPAV